MAGKHSAPTGRQQQRPLPGTAPPTSRCDLCGEATNGPPRHAAVSECFVALRQALDTAREEITLARGRLALIEHRASRAQESLRAVAELLGGAMTPKTLPRLFVRIKELVAPHAVNPAQAGSKPGSGAAAKGRKVR